MKKRVLGILLAMILSFSVAIPAVATGSYPDLEGHWAKEYMLKLVAKGYLSGYSDGKMKPDVNITTCEALVLLSRFYKLDDDTQALVYTDYGKSAEEAAPASMSWAYDELALCLAAGIVKTEELDSINLSAAIGKELLSVFMVRAMQLQSEADKLAASDLKFDDAADISKDYIGSVALLSSLGIVAGDDNNNYSPKLSVTRAVVATMVVRCINYLEAEGITCTIDAYDGLSHNEGIITAASTSSVKVCGLDGLTREYTIPTAASVKVNDTVKALSSAYIGCFVKITLDEGIVTGVAVDSKSGVEWVQGAFISMYTYEASYIFTITDSESGEIKQFTIPYDMAITKDGAAVKATALTMNDFLSFKFEANKPTAVYAESCASTLTGTITEIKYGTTVTLKLKDAEGTAYCFDMNISNIPPIERAKTTITIDRLSVGDEISMTMENCSIKSIAAAGSEVTITGELTAINTTTTGTMWTITDANGTATTLSVGESAYVYSDDKAILLSAIQVGDTISVVTYGTTILEVNLESAAISTSKVVGTVLLLDTSNKTVTILTASDKLIYIKAASVVTIINASTGSTVNYSAIPIGASLVVYGKYSNSTTFAAVAIIIEE